MARIQHGEVASLQEVEKAVTSLKQENEKLGMAAAPLREAGLTRFDFMFPQLQANGSLLVSEKPEKLVEDLIHLGYTMNDQDENKEFDSGIPAAYTYFGQFVAHDITFELQSDQIAKLTDPKLVPLTSNVVRSSIKNRRSPTLDLDCVYGVTSDGSPVPRVGHALAVGVVSKSGDRPQGTDENNDLPRKPPSKNPPTDREALIGDARNDQNLILAQLHVAFLRAHNSLVNDGMTYSKARKTLVEHYQWLIIHDYLKKIADKQIVNDILTHGNRFYRPPINDLYMPLEFSAAAFRFGHTMVRGSYDYNQNFTGDKKADLLRLFALTSFSGELAGFEKVPEKWIIEWKRFLNSKTNPARRINTQLVDPLKKLQDVRGKTIEGVNGSLAVRNLLRGYLLRTPIGQKVAQAMGFPPLTENKILAAAANPEQAEIVGGAGFSKETPLWYYILAEASDRTSLGPVGSTIVAEVLIGLIRWTEDSILSQPGWKPTLGSTPGTFTLQDFFTLAGVWN